MDQVDKGKDYDLEEALVVAVVSIALNLEELVGLLQNDRRSVGVG